MFNYDSNESDYGYYTVNNKIYINKIEAIIAAEQVGARPNFIFNDDIYSKLDWTREPTETLEQLYAKRAWELRNKYDYLILHYSGGWDSNNILETFIANKIPLDELYLRGPLSTADKDITNTESSNMYAEIYFNALPIAKYVKETYYPNLVITVVDSTTNIVDFFKSEKNAMNFCSPTRRGANYSPSSVGTRTGDYDLLVANHTKLTETGKRVGNMLGIDKPMIHFENGEFKVRFLDKFLGTFFPGRASEFDLPTFQEPFYWSQSTGPLISKQVHSIKNYIKNNGLAGEIINDSRNRKYHDFIANIIYKRKFPVTFNAKKIEGISVLRPWETYFLHDSHTDYLKNWRNGMDQLNKLVPDKWKHGGSIYNDVLGIFTKSYSVGA